MAPAPLLDRIIEQFSPAWAQSRARARFELKGLQAATALYDGATRGRRSEGWRLASTDANSEIMAAGTRLRDVARDMVRNVPLAQRAKQLVVDNTVGTQIKITPKIQGQRRQAKVSELVKQHCETTAIDATGLHDLYGIQALVLGTVMEAGEALVLRVRRRSSDGLPLPFQLKVIEPDHLDTTFDGPQPNGHMVVNGIEFDSRDRRVAYHIFDEHPGSTGPRWPRRTRWPAEDVAHVFRVDRPGQVRGVTWFAPVVLRMNDLADYNDAQVLRQKIAACFAGFVETDDRASGLAAKAAASGENPDRPAETIEPGMIQRLRSGEKMSFTAPPAVTDYEPFNRQQIREIAVGLGLSYEALSGALSDVNFSSGRMGWLEFHRAIERWRWHMLIPQLCYPLERWLTEALVLVAGAQPGLSYKWTPPRREMIDPTKEIPAARDAIRSGLSSRTRELDKLGEDIAEIDAEIAEETTRSDAARLSFDSDGRRPIAAPVQAQGQNNG